MAVLTSIGTRSPHAVSSGANTNSNTTQIFLLMSSPLDVESSECKLIPTAPNASENQGYAVICSGLRTFRGRALGIFNFLQLLFQTLLFRLHRPETRASRFSTTRRQLKVHTVLVQRSPRLQTHLLFLAGQGTILASVCV